MKIKTDSGGSSPINLQYSPAGISHTPTDRTIIRILVIKRLFIPELIIIGKPITSIITGAKAYKMFSSEDEEYPKLKV